MVYRKIATCNGNDILERLSEEELAAYHREKKNQKRKWERKTKVGGLGAGIIGIAFPIILIIIDLFIR
ncbi:hypothetical protein H9X90_05275 [Faecalicatena contorta]|uniref:hypothetical protein n=1 Tax=Faecalicatena contorta TaxID=39482 RepID=UPI0019603949|nr:hypothetical protein [Faecalicatena contorta]MBM6685415.1 hypothetical protein [Faecalicatena contorta]MBM6710156.1 hypothetical protein [Faecalicatena contorta]